MTKAGVAATSVLVLSLIGLMLGDVASTQGSRLIPLIRAGMFTGVGLFFVAAAIVLVARQRRPSAAVETTPAATTADAAAPFVDVPLVLAGLGLIAVLSWMLVVIPFTPENRGPTLGFSNSTFLLAMLFGLGAALRGLRPLRNARALAALGSPAFFWTLVGLLCAVHVARIVADPSAHIDVFRTITHGIKSFIAGENPYAMIAPDLAEWLQFGPVPEQLQYPPATLLTLTPFFAMFGDYRYAFVFAGLGAVLLIVRMSTPRARPMAYVLALLLLCWPDTWGKSWTESLMAFFAVWAVYNLAMRPNSRITAVSLGLFASQKQYSILLVPQLFAFQKGLSRIGLTVLFASVTSIPFLLWSPGLFYDSVVGFHTKAPFRIDGITLSATLSGAAGAQWPGWLSMGLGAATSFVATWLFRRRGAVGFTLAVASALLVSFLFHRYAFANHYQLVFYFLVAATFLVYRDGLPAAEPAATTAELSATPAPAVTSSATEKRSLRNWVIAGIVVAIVPTIILLTGFVGRADWSTAAARILARAAPGDAIYLRTASASQRAAHFAPLPVLSPEHRLDEPRPAGEFQRLWFVSHRSRAGARRPPWLNELQPREHFTVGDIQVELFARR